MNVIIGIRFSKLNISYRYFLLLNIISRFLPINVGVKNTLETLYFIMSCEASKAWVSVSQTKDYFLLREG